MSVLLTVSLVLYLSVKLYVMSVLLTVSLVRPADRQSRPLRVH